MDQEGVIEISCPICLGSGEADFATLLCGHVFHLSCIERSLKHGGRKKRCPTCRVPVEPEDCMCSSGKPLKLFNITLHPSKAQAGGTPGNGGTPIRCSAPNDELLAQLHRMRSALGDSNIKVGELEGRLEASKAEIEQQRRRGDKYKALVEDKKQELAEAMARWEQDKQGMGNEIRRLGEDVRRAQGTISKLRTELDTTVREKDGELVRLRHQMRLKHAKTPGTSLTPQQVEEILEGHKEDFKEVYAIKVSELTAAQAAVQELQAALSASQRAAEEQAARERSEAAERLKQAAAERDEAKRQLLQAEYELDKARARLEAVQHEQQPARASFASARSAPHASLHQGPSRLPQPSGVPAAVAAVGSKRPAGQSGPLHTWVHAEKRGPGQHTGAAAAAQPSVPGQLLQQRGPHQGAGGADTGAADERFEDAYEDLDNDLLELAGMAQEDDGCEQPLQRLTADGRQQHNGNGVGPSAPEHGSQQAAAAGCTEADYSGDQDMGDGCGTANGDDAGGEEAPCYFDEDGAEEDLNLNLPPLPGALVGSLTGRAAAVGGASVSGVLGVAGNKGSSFLQRAGAPGSGGGSSLIRQGTDGRGGMARYPLASSLAQQQQQLFRGPGGSNLARKAGSVPAKRPAPSAGGRSGGSDNYRIDAFLQPKKK